jgi:mannose-6-phosphate isomerase-like protein (cupin superfamily)
MSYTLRNLDEVKDAAAEFGISEIQQSRFPAADVGAERTGLAHHVLRPGKRTPFGHRHEQAEEIHVVLRGSGRARLDDEEVELAPMDVLRVSPETTRAFEAGPDGLEYLVFGPRHEGDGEVDRDFWAG